MASNILEKWLERRKPGRRAATVAHLERLASSIQSCIPKGIFRGPDGEGIYLDMQSDGISKTGAARLGVDVSFLFKLRFVENHDFDPNYCSCKHSELHDGRTIVFRKPAYVTDFLAPLVAAVMPFEMASAVKDFAVEVPAPRSKGSTAQPVGTYMGIPHSRWPAFYKHVSCQGPEDDDNWDCKLVATKKGSPGNLFDACDLWVHWMERGIGGRFNFQRLIEAWMPEEQGDVEVQCSEKVLAQLALLSDPTPCDCVYLVDALNKCPVDLSLWSPDATGHTILISDQDMQTMGFLNKEQDSYEQALLAAGLIDHTRAEIAAGAGAMMTGVGEGDDEDAADDAEDPGAEDAGIGSSSAGMQQLSGHTGPLGGHKRSRSPSHAQEEVEIEAEESGGEEAASDRRGRRKAAKAGEKPSQGAGHAHAVSSRTGIAAPLLTPAYSGAGSGTGRGPGTSAGAPFSPSSQQTEATGASGATAAGGVRTTTVAHGLRTAALEAEIHQLRARLAAVGHSNQLPVSSGGQSSSSSPAPGTSSAVPGAQLLTSEQQKMVVKWADRAQDLFQAVRGNGSSASSSVGPSNEQQVSLQAIERLAAHFEAYEYLRGSIPSLVR